MPASVEVREELQGPGRDGQQWRAAGSGHRTKAAAIQHGLQSQQWVG